MLPVFRSTSLGSELDELSRDDGARLAEILAELRKEAARDPANLHTRNALVTALSRAGLATEAHAEAWRAYEGLRRVPGVPSDVRLNVAAGLSEAGRVSEAKECFEASFARDPSPAAIFNMGCMAVRFAEFAWLERLVPGHPIPRYLEDINLADYWSRQQKAIEKILRPHVSTFGAALEDFRDGTGRLIIDYYVDTTDPTRIAELDEAVWQAIETVYEEHPDGPGALLGVALINVNGILIPLPAESP